MSGGSVSLKGVTKSWGDTTALNNVSLDVPAGQFTALLGPSGCGKSTALRIVSGLDDPTSGQVFIDGEDVTDAAPAARDIAMVFQSYALFPHLSVAENIIFGLRVRGLSRSDRDQKLKAAAELLGLGHLLDRRPSQLSGGQQQRVAVARALVFDPDLVLMDEPLGALDKQLREQMQYEIKHIHERLGVTVVYVTHDQSEALTMSNRIAVFEDGVIQQLASPSDLYERPDNAFVAQFIGENNRLTGVVKSIEGDQCQVTLDSGEEIQALKVNIGAVGERATLSLRPERVEVNPEPGKFPNAFNAKVEELIYLGDHIRTRASVCGNSEFIVKIPNATHHASLNEGDSVMFGWSMEDCRALDVPPTH